MEKPTSITVALLEVLIMPNGEVIHQGKIIGWFRELEEFLSEKPKGA